MRDWRRCAVVLVGGVLASLAGGARVWGQGFDAIYLRPTAPGAPASKLTGTLSEWNGEGVVLISVAGREQKIAAPRIARVEPRRSAAWESARRTLQAGDLAGASEQFARLLEATKPVWERREIEALLAISEAGQGGYATAAQRVLAILEDDPKSRHLEALPLAWNASTFQAPSASPLQKWMGDPSPFARLLAASWLLSGSDPARAQRVLDTLASDKDPRIAWLAEAQQWRAKSLTASAAEVDRFEKRVGLAPEELRAGPTLLVALARSRLKLWNRSAADFCRIPLLHPDQAPMAGDATYFAARDLAAAGMSLDARQLFEKVLSMPCAKGWHEEARGRLAALVPLAAPTSP